MSHLWFVLHVPLNATFCIWLFNLYYFVFRTYGITALCGRFVSTQRITIAVIWSIAWTFVMRHKDALEINFNYWNVISNNILNYIAYDAQRSAYALANHTKAFIMLLIKTARFLFQSNNYVLNVCHREIHANYFTSNLTKNFKRIHVQKLVIDLAMNKAKLEHLIL